MTILDPTCGSGAFLFAALNILEPLYDACLNRMQTFVDELDNSGERHRPEKFSDFRKTLERVRQHYNRRYFILKSIIIGNLYGVDIMAEATEICKLRLFLKLVAQLERAEDIEPLPDIDFNIRAGNTLVGFATYDEVKRAVTSKLSFDEDMARIDESAEIAARAFERFHEMQTEQGMDAGEFHIAKEELRRRLNVLCEELDCYLAGEYGIKERDKDALRRWRESHKPFHWFIEFYGIVRNGGFDVIIGNPPYVEYSKVRNEYKILGFVTESCGNLYTYVVERSSRLLHPKSWLGLIVPLGGFATARMGAYQQLLPDNYKTLHISFFSGDANPSVMFEGVKYRLAILLGCNGKSKSTEIYTSKYLRWYAEERPLLFSKITYVKCPFNSGYLRFCKLGVPDSSHIMEKLLNRTEKLGIYERQSGNGVIHYHRSPVNWIRAMDFEPYFNSATRNRSEDHLRDLVFENKMMASAAGAILNSTCFFFWFISQGNCRDIAGPDISDFPVGHIDPSLRKSLDSVFDQLITDLKRNSRRRVYNYQTSGRVEYDEFYPKLSKKIIDDIDDILAKHYELSTEETDFLINFDIKYRMGRDRAFEEE